MSDDKKERPVSPFVFDKGEASQEEIAEAEAVIAAEAEAGAAKPQAEVPLTGDKPGFEGHVVNALRTVYDPEIPVNLYDLGLIYRIGISEDEKNIEIDMTLTAPGCPVAEILPGQVEHAVRGMNPGVEDVTVTIVWEPPWNPGMMTEAARLELGMFY
jgi:FeS assembly SUF system protein